MASEELGRVVGFDRLAAWAAEDESRTPTFIANVLGIRPPAVFQWRVRKTRPAEEIRDALFLLTGIPPEDWLTESERARAAKAMAGVAAIAKSGSGEHAIDIAEERDTDVDPDAIHRALTSDPPAIGPLPSLDEPDGDAA